MRSVGPGPKIWLNDVSGTIRAKRLIEIDPEISVRSRRLAGNRLGVGKLNLVSELRATRGIERMTKYGDTKIGERAARTAY